MSLWGRVLHAAGALWADWTALRLMGRRCAWCGLPTVPLTRYRRVYRLHAEGERLDFCLVAHHDCGPLPVAPTSRADMAWWGPPGLRLHLWQVGRGGDR